MSEHGTTSRYTRGCRCARCRAANAGYQRAYQAKRRLAAEGYAWADSITNTTEPLHDGGVSSTTAPGAWTYQVRSPLEQLVDACIDLREAFAAYHQAHTQEPAA